jgi:hypothetical protein
MWMMIIIIIMSDGLPICFPVPQGSISMVREVSRKFQVLSIMMMHDK